MKHIVRAPMVSPTRHHLTWFQLVRLAKKKFLKSNLVIITIPLLCMVKELYWHQLGVGGFRS